MYKNLVGIISILRVKIHMSRNSKLFEAVGLSVVMLVLCIMVVVDFCDMAKCQEGEGCGGRNLLVTRRKL